MALPTLTAVVDAAHERIASALQEVNESAPPGTRDFDLACDAALGSLCQHLIGVEVTVAPLAARRLPGGRRRVRDAMLLTRRLESTVRLLIQRLWGDSHAPRVPLEVLQKRLMELLPEHCREEAELLSALEAVLEPDERDALAARLEAATARAPTRPHQHAWRRLGSSRLYYRLVGAWDRALDVMDCRTLPQRRRSPAAPGLWSSYLLGAQLPEQQASLQERPEGAGARDTEPVD